MMLALEEDSRFRIRRLGWGGVLMVKGWAKMP